MQTLTKDQIKSLLSSILPEYKRISEAPTLSMIEELEDKRGLKPDTLVKLEREKRYKSMDWEGNVHLIQNPAVWEFSEDERGSRTYYRPQPQKVMTHRQATEAAGSSEFKYTPKKLGSNF